MFNSIITTREKRTRNQETLSGNKRQVFVVTGFLGLQPIKLVAESQQNKPLTDETDTETETDDNSDEIISIKIPRIGYVSPVKCDEHGSYPQTRNVGVLFDDKNMDFTIMELHRTRELTSWKVETKKIFTVHNLCAAQYTKMICWMIEACTKLKLPRECFHGAVAIVLRYMNTRSIRIIQLQFQLVALCAIWIMYRMEEVSTTTKTPFLSVLTIHETALAKAYDFLRLFDNCYRPEDLLASEKDIATVLQYDFSLRSCYHWVNLIISYGKQLNKNPEQMTHWTEFKNIMKCYQLLDAMMASFDLAEYKPSLVAAVALCIIHPEDASLVYRLSSVKATELLHVHQYTKWMCSDYVERWQYRYGGETAAVPTSLEAEDLPETVDEQFYDEEMLELLLKQRDSLVHQWSKKLPMEEEEKAEQEEAARKQQAFTVIPIPELVL